MTPLVRMYLAIAGCFVILLLAVFAYGQHLLVVDADHAYENLLRQNREQRQTILSLRHEVEHQDEAYRQCVISNGKY